MEEIQNKTNIIKPKSTTPTTSIDVKNITKQTSAITNSYTDDFSCPNHLNLSYNSIHTEKKHKKRLLPESPFLKRSQSHKSNHFKVEIVNIINEELDEDDAEPLNYINEELSPKTKLLAINLLADNGNNKVIFNKYDCIKGKEDDFGSFNDNEEDMQIDSFLFDDTNFDFECQKEEINDGDFLEDKKVKNIPTILKRILEQEAMMTTQNKQ